MNWSDVAKSIASYAPQISTVLAATGVGAPVAAAISAAGALVSSALGVPNDPEAVNQAIVTDPSAIIKLKQIEADHGEHLAQIAAGRESNQLAADTSALATVNQTMQVEDNTRKFSWRDYWGYVSGTAFAFVVLDIMYIVWASVYYTKPEMLATIPGVVGAFTTLFGIAAAVLGVHSSIEAYHSGLAARGQ